MVDSHGGNVNKFNRLYKFAIELPDPKDTNVHVHDIGRYEDENGFVSTVAILEGFGGDKRDRRYTYETAIKGNNADMRLVEKYDSTEEAVAGHEKWVKAYKEWWSGDLLNKSNESKTYNADDDNELFTLIKNFAKKYGTDIDELHEMLLEDNCLGAMKAFCKSKNLGEYICKLLANDPQFKKDCDELITANQEYLNKNDLNYLDFETLRGLTK